MAARTTAYAESLGEVSKTTTGFTDVVLLTHTPNSNTDVLYFWSASMQVVSTADDVQFQVNHDTGSTVYAEGNIEAHESSSPVDYYAVGGVFVISYGASPGSQDISIEYASETGGVTVKAKDARIWALELGANDKFVNGSSTPQADSSASSFTDLTSGSLTFTPGSTGDYLILSSLEMNGSTSTLGLFALDEDGAIPGDTAQVLLSDTTTWLPLTTFDVINLDTSSHTIKIKFDTNGAITWNGRRGRVIALRLSDFEQSYTNENRTASSGSGTSYTTASSLNPTIVNAVKHVVLASWWHGENSTTSSTYSQFTNGTTVFAENIYETQSGTSTIRKAPAVAYEATLAAGSGVTWSIQRKSETAIFSNIDETIIAILQIEAAGGGTVYGSTTKLSANPLPILGVGRNVFL